jgi:ribonucleoside-triphosphate reductase
MRNLEDIEQDLAAARETLLTVEGTPAEVYSRIVGYYRSVRNWNLGKREEYGERRLYRIRNDRPGESSSGNVHAARPSPSSAVSTARGAGLTEETLLLLFVRPACPACPPAKAAAGQLGIPVELVNADTAEGMAEALRRNVMSTPTAILISPEGRELKRAADAETISRLLSSQQVQAMPVAV